MSNIDLPTPADIDLGKHRIPDSLRKQAELLTRVGEPKFHKVPDNIGYQFDEPKFINQQESVTKLPINTSSETFIRNYPKEAEDLISWYTNIKNSKSTKNKLSLGIPGFPFKVKINPLLLKKDENYLTVFVKSDNSLEISLPVAAEVILEGEINGEVLDATTGMFLGEVIFDRNFLFKILIFVVK